ncbi:MAG: prepilin peptidase [Planctomycetales bacterium]|nr:prepilin peptidase [Planctomycetales bacterium]
MVSTALLLVLAGIAGITDTWHHKIYNWTTYPGILLAIVVSHFEPGGIGIEESLKGFLLCGLVMLVSFVFFNVGGGDVKLMAMLGAFLGIDQGLEVLLWTFVLGGLAALITLIWRFGLANLVSRGLRHLWWMLRLGQPVPLADDERLALQPPLYLARTAFVAVVIVKFQLQNWEILR